MHTNQGIRTHSRFSYGQQHEINYVLFFAKRALFNYLFCSNKKKQISSIYASRRYIMTFTCHRVYVTLMIYAEVLY